MSSVAFLGPQNAPKCLAAGALPLTPLGSSQRFPDPIARFKAVYFKAPTFKVRERGKEGAPK